MWLLPNRSVLCIILAFFRACAGVMFWWETMATTPTVELAVILFRHPPCISNRLAHKRTSATARENSSGLHTCTACQAAPFTARSKSSLVSVVVWAVCRVLRVAPPWQSVCAVCCELRAAAPWPSVCARAESRSLVGCLVVVVVVVDTLVWHTGLELREAARQTYLCTLRVPLPSLLCVRTHHTIEPRGGYATAWYRCFC
jgi:hypothetical protein